MLSSSELDPLHTFFKRSTHYFLAERYYLFSLIKRRDSYSNQRFEARFILVLIKFFKFSMHFFTTLGIFLRTPNPNEFLDSDILLMFLELVRSLLSDLLVSFEDLLCPKNFKVLMKNLRRTYFDVYENIVMNSRDYSRFNQYFGLLDELVRKEIDRL